MPIPNATYPFDPTGVAPSNLVPNERQIIPSANSKGFIIIVPFKAPYFRSSLKVIYVPNGRELVEGVDYYCTHYFYDATAKIGQPIYGSITMIDKTLVGSVSLTYQTIGGDWTLDEAEIERILAQTMLDPRKATWEQIVDLPFQFPPVDHPHDVNDEMGRFERVVEACYDIAAAIEAAGQGASESHINNRNNPHEVTAAQVGLGSVLNAPMATPQEAIDGNIVARYINPVTLKAAVMAQVGNAVAAHLSDQNNPHQTTKGQVGLGSVPDLAMATLQEAVDGALANRFMNPAGTLAQINARLSATLTVHEDRRDNPHGVTAGQVGLGFVPNYPMATPQQAIAGMATDAFMSPALVKLFNDSYIGDTLYGHIADHENPHAVTKQQVGLGNVVNLPLASLVDAVEGTSDSGYITPRLMFAAFSAWTDGTGQGGLAAHLLDFDNPHQVTAEQVGAYDKGTVDLLLGNKVDRGETVANSARVGGLLPADIINQATNKYTWGPVNPQTIDDGSGGTITLNAGETYTLLGHFAPEPGNDPAINPPADIAFYYTGGEARESNDAPSFLIRLNLYSVISMSVEQLSGIGDGIGFGYTKDVATGSVSIYSKNPPLRNPIAVMVISDNSDSMGAALPPQDQMPVGYINADNFAGFDATISPDSVAGEVTFGRNPHLVWSQEPDVILSDINVIENTSDEVDAIAAEGDLKLELGDWLRMSSIANQGRDASPAETLGWQWDATKLNHNAKSTTLVTLRSPDSYVDYSFEVDVTIGSDVDAGQGGVGVCVASTRVNGKDYSIHAIRYGAAPSNPARKYLTVGMNLYQSDETDLGSTNGSLSAISNWSTGNTCRIRVTRVGNIITIKSSNFSSVNVDEGATVTIDLDSDERLSVFKRPTAWGLAKYASPMSGFAVLSRPDQYQPYILVSADMNGNDTSTIHRYNGAAWVSQPLKLDQSFIKPGRIIYSRLTCILYMARRDGTLKKLPTVPFSTDGTIILVP